MLPGSSVGLRYVLLFFILWKIINVLTTQQLLKLEKKSTNLEFLEYQKWCFTKFESNQFLPYKISCQFRVMTKFYTGWNILIEKMRLPA